MPSLKQITVLRFNGPRFEDHGLDVDVLPEIGAYKRLLQETAKEIWRRKHPDRVRLPRKFEAGINLKFFGLQAGSTGVPLMRELPIVPNPFLMVLDDELDEAAVVLEEGIRAAGEQEGVPSALPRNVIPLFEEFGKTLHEDEFLLISAGERKIPVRYDAPVKQRILAWASSSYTDVVDLVGEVRATDLDGLKFTLRLEDGRKVTGRFQPEHEAVVLEALGEHFIRRMRVGGTGQFEPYDGVLRQIVEVDRIELINPAVALSGDVPIWDRLASIGAAAPKDAWDGVPTDLSANVDHYLYGGKKDRD